MEILKEVSRKILDSEGKEIKAGETVLLIVGDRQLVGVYEGITKKGALAFKGNFNDSPTFNLLPGSIKESYHCKITM